MKFKSIKIIAATGILFYSFVVSPCVLATENQPVEATIESAAYLEKAQCPRVIEVKTLIKSKEIEIEDAFDYVYTADRVNIRTNTNIESEILLTAEVGTKLQRIKKDIIPGWDCIRINDSNYYISNEYITIKEPEQLAESIEQQLEDSKISTSDLRYMSAIIYAEAGNQCEAGQQAVGIIVMNRVTSKKYKDTVYDVINEPSQFSPVKDGSFIKALNYYDSGDIPECVIKAAKYALRGNTTINYNNETYDLDGYLYFSRYINGCRIQIQDHMFK